MPAGDPPPNDPDGVRQPRLVSAVAVVVVGVVVAALNLGALAADLQIRGSGHRVTFRVERCVADGRARVCTGSYSLGGVVFGDRLLLGGDGAHAGDTVDARVARPGGDASTSGWSAAVEAALLAAVGLVVLLVGVRRVLRARRRPRRSPRPRSLRARARVWEREPPTAEPDEP